MNHMALLDRAWQQVGIGVFLLVLAFLQILIGTAVCIDVTTTGVKNGFKLCRRDENPRTFWLSIITVTILGLVAAGAGLPLIIQSS